jgi:hypothetical protein
MLRTHTNRDTNRFADHHKHLPTHAFGELANEAEDDERRPAA